MGVLMIIRTTFSLRTLETVSLVLHLSPFVICGRSSIPFIPGAC